VTVRIGAGAALTELAERRRVELAEQRYDAVGREPRGGAEEVRARSGHPVFRCCPNRSTGTRVPPHRTPASCAGPGSSARRSAGPLSPARKP
jgi:hypothetical protein